MILKFSKKQVYHEKYYLKQYNNNYFRIIYCKAVREKGFESDKKKNNLDKTEEIERVSLSRTKKSIREIAFCNDFNFFATFTINSEVCDRYSLDACQNELKKMLKAYKRKNPNFKYLFITEKHKNGAFHFHGLVSGLSDFYVNDNGYLSSKHWDKLGFNSFSKIKDYNKTCNYITKYISKDCVRNSHNQIYICSRGLKRPDVYEIPKVDIDWQFENDFVKCKDSYNFTKKEQIAIYNLDIDNKKNYV